MSRPDNKKNLRSEKEGFDYLRKVLKGFYLPDLAEKKILLKLLGMPERYSRSFDVISMKAPSVSQITRPDQVKLYEVKVTKKHLPEFPKGFFFGMTANEDELLKKHEDCFAICLVSINDTKNVHLILTHTELSKLIRTKRVQYQINL
jgi:hypothetical protein